MGAKKTTNSNCSGDTQYTIAVRGHKGGTGKSTVTMNLAIGFACAGFSVALIDLDRQQTSFKILQRRAKLNDPTLARVDYFNCEGINEMYQLVADLPHEVIIFDTAGNIGSGMASACLLFCKLVILPFNTSRLDIDTAASVNDILNEVKQDANISSFAMANRLTTHHLRRPRKLQYLKEAFEGLENLPLLESSFSNREIYTDSMDESRSVLEFTGKAAEQAGEEVKGLICEILGIYNSKLATNKKTVSNNE